MKLLVSSILVYASISVGLSTFFLGFNITEAQDDDVLAVKLQKAETPILIASKNESPKTKVQALDISNVSGDLKQVVVNISDPKYLLGVEARIGDIVVGSYEFNGIFNVDLNTPTKPTQVPIQIDSISSKEALNKSKELSIWTSPSEYAAPDKIIKIGVQSLTANRKIIVNGLPLEYRFGSILRDKGWDNVAAYRIPGLVYTPKGTLIAVYDARNNNPYDLPGDIDVACSRSFDKGKTWEPMQIIVDLSGENEKLEGVGDPAILVDDKTGRIWVAALWAHNGKSLAQSAPGLELGTSGQIILVYSDDDGKTWSKPRNITKEVAPDKDWRMFFQGPGSGICTRDGKLIFPAQVFDKAKNFYSTILWSDDSGVSWHIGTSAKDSTCESQVVELNDGSLLLNMRNYNTREFSRSVSVTKDLGKTWETHESSGKLLCPICQASLIRVASTKDGDKASLLAFMNPYSSQGRVNMTLQLSEDEGKTWGRSLTLYQPQCFGYSSLAKIDADTIGVLYETQGGLIYQTIKTQDVQ